MALPTRLAITPHGKHIIEHGKTEHNKEVMADVDKCAAFEHYHSHHLHEVFDGVEMVDELRPFGNAVNGRENQSIEFVIKAKNVSAKNIYVQSAKLNGTQLETPFLHHSDIMNGGILEFEMGNQPVKGW